MTLRVSAVCALALAACLLAAGCGGSDGGNGGDGLSGRITADGSSTVGPFTSYAAEAFQKLHSGVQITVGISGTGGGFERFCAGETDLSNASRPIKDEETAACKEAGIEYVELQVANDALSVVVNNGNDWAECLTVEQLKRIWEPGSKLSRWNQVDPAFPDEKIVLFGPGTDSGTFDFFTAEIVGEEGASRSDYQASENDNVLVQGVKGQQGALGYFGFSYYDQNRAGLKALAVDSGGGCVAPGVATAQDGTYKPLSRPLLVYVKRSALERPEVKAFLDYVVDEAKQIAEASLFVPLTDSQLGEARQRLDEAG
ncbi:MAG: PstS family phosphate ABC transporter substrate-binding protein [Gaiellaceae bacterium]